MIFAPSTVVASLCLLWCGVPQSLPTQASPSNERVEPTLRDTSSRETVDRAAIRAAYDAHRHRIRSVNGGLEARNHGQRWSLRFDRRGATVVPDHGAWSWGLALERYGWGEDVVPVAAEAAATCEENRAAYRWDERLVEWFVNDARGLEHGFTVDSRPDGASGLLRLDLSVRGGLRPEVLGRGRDVRFTRTSGAVALTYSGLTVFDADGERIGARFVATDEGLRLLVEEHEAVYPLTIDPIAQQAYLKATNPDASDHFGWAIAVHGDTVVVGAPWEDSATTIVDGNQNDDTASKAGAAYVFVREAGAWTQQAYLKASNADAGDEFGAVVDVHNDTIVVGATGEDGSSSGVGGDGDDDGADGSGAVYVFVREAGAWTQQAYVKAQEPGPVDSFGCSVAIDEDTLVVGALGEDGSSTGVNGDQTDQGAFESGAAYVFRRSGDDWSQAAYLKASNTQAGDEFGVSVDVHGDTVAVGSHRESSAATGVGGDQSDNGAPYSGAVYVFTRTGSSWSQQAYLKASNTDQNDGFAGVAVHGDRLAVGASGESSASGGVNGDQSDDSANGAGAVYVFARTGTAWSQEAYLKAAHPDGGDLFGLNLDMSVNRIAVGAYGESSASAGIGGDETDDSMNSTGAVYLFALRAGGWTQAAFVKASNPDEDDEFGTSVGIDGNTLVTGARYEESGSRGVNADQSDNGLFRAGAAYVFDLASPIVDQFCFDGDGGAPCPCSNPGGPGKGCENSTGAGALLTAQGSSFVADDELAFTVTGAVPGQPALLLQGESFVDVPFRDGRLCIGVPSERVEVVLLDGVGSGTTTSSIATNGDAAAGDVRYYQLWYRDPNPAAPCGTGSNLTQGLVVRWR